MFFFLAPETIMPSKRPFHLENQIVTSIKTDLAWHASKKIEREFSPYSYSHKKLNLDVDFSGYVEAGKCFEFTLIPLALNVNRSST